jgi:O-antigen/teichoic acid export membrane protein
LPFILTGIFAPAGFRIIGGDEWFQAGVYMRYLLPWFFLVFLSSPLSFLPDMLKRQRKAMWIDIIKFVLRLIALYTGIRMDSIDLAILLFSGISGLLVAYNLYWYLNLSAAADRIRGQKR